MKKYVFLSIILITAISAFSQYSLDKFSNSYAVLMEFPNGSSGSGFFYSDSLYLYFVTASHVFAPPQINPLTNRAEYNLIDSLVTLSFYSRNPEVEERKMIRLNLRQLYFKKELLFNTESDIAVVRIGNLSNEGYAHVDYRKFVDRIGQNATVHQFVTADVTAYPKVGITNDVFIFGYPKSLGLRNSPQYDFSKPLIRKGIVAGRNKNQKSIIIDCPSYGGNSGGPVVQVNIETMKIELIGLVTEFIPYEEKWVNQNFKIENIEWSNSGYSVGMSFDWVQDLITLIQRTGK